jgi:TPR repeat protein
MMDLSIAYDSFASIRNEKKAFQWAERAYGNGACFRGCFERDPSTGKPWEPGKRDEYLKLDSVHGVVYGVNYLLWYLGIKYACGLGCEINYMRGLFLMLRAIELGYDNDGDAEGLMKFVALIRFRASGLDVNTPTKEELVAWMENHPDVVSSFDMHHPPEELRKVFEQVQVAALANKELKHMRRCRNCCAESENLRICARCKSVCYCSKECQEMDWRLGLWPHKSICDKMARLWDERPGRSDQEALASLSKSLATQYVEMWGAKT